MNRNGLTSWLLLGAMTLLFSGAAQSVHERQHHWSAVVADHADCPHDGPSDPPESPLPTDHGDCPTCYLLTHIKASPLDLIASVTLTEPTGFVAPMAPRIIITAKASYFPPGRGPPSSIHL